MAVIQRSYRKSGRLIPKREKGLRARSVALDAAAVMPWHTTGSREELLLVIAGRVRVELKRGFRTVAAGDSLFLPAQTAHQVVSRSKGIVRYVYVTGAAGR